jgi:hypothetical protein
MLARLQQAGRDLAVQRVPDHHADRVDVRGLGDGLPAGLGPLVAVAAGGVGGERSVGVGDGHQPHVRQPFAEHGRRGPVPAGVRAAGHSGPDDRDPDRRRRHGGSSRCD